MFSRKVMTAVLCATMAGALPAFAQQAGGPGGGGPGGGRFDPQQMRERMQQRIKETMGATDDEWKVLQPKVEKVQQLQMNARGGFGFGGFGRRGGGGGGNDQQPTTPVGIASQDLRTTLENKDAGADVIKQKLQALRDARAKAQAEVTAAQAELKELLTARQEAALVSMNILE